MDVEMLVVDDCPSAPAASEVLRSALHDIGLSERAFRVSVVGSAEQAQDRGFVGSPTFAVDGAELFPVAAEQPALACRVYPNPGGCSGLPDLRDLRQALKRAAAVSVG